MTKTDSRIQEILDQQRPGGGGDFPEVEISESEFFGIWKGIQDDNEVRFLDLRFRDGQRTCFDYPDRKFVNYDPEVPCIDINFDGTLVTILGRGIEPVYDLITRRKLAWLKEADKPDGDDEELPLFIQDLYITPEEGLPEEQSADRN